MISVWPAGQVIIWCGKNFDVVVVFFSDTLNVIDVKLCMMVLLIELYLFVPLSLGFFLVLVSPVLQGHNSVIKYHMKILCYCPITLKVSMIVNYVD